jgi:hypothetical protein
MHPFGERFLDASGREIPSNLTDGIREFKGVGNSTNELITSNYRRELLIETIYARLELL